LWPVDDRGTLEFMIVLHHSLQTKLLGESWLAARDHLKNKEYAPYVYGAFVLGGSRY